MIFNILIAIAYEMLVSLGLGVSAFYISLFLLRYIKNNIIKKEIKNENRKLFYFSLLIVIIFMSIKSYVDIKLSIIEQILKM
ncbi:hypothetical protein UFVDC4_00185 [Staphylococcus phage vB_SauM-UFV_DC4]|nr:hypothetical protein UFVDC4_00185 [Staphylococcus phage vB_SauM-UFV_DC4]BDE75765.1 hypothetical protein [Staphylococcus phage S6]